MGMGNCLCKLLQYKVYILYNAFRVSQLIRQRIEKVYVDQVKMRDYH